MNKVILIGTLRSKVELKKLNNGVPVANFVLVVKRKSQNEYDYISCVAYRATAELLHKYTDKNSLISVEGSINVSHIIETNTTK